MLFLTTALQSRDNLGKHLIRKQPGEIAYRYQCDLCDFKTAYTWCMITHKRKHTGEELHKCDFCKFRTAHAGNMVTHIRRKHTGEQTYECDSARKYLKFKMSDIKDVHNDKLITNIETTVNHRSHDGESSGIPNDEQGPENCLGSTENYLISSETKSSGSRKVTVTDSKSEIMYMRDVNDSSCQTHESINIDRDTRTRMTKSAGRKFPGTNHGDRSGVSVDSKPYKCAISNNSTTESDNLGKHLIRKQPGEIAYRYQCDLCDFKTAYTWCMITHKRKHTGEELHKCDFCKFRTAHARNMATHIRRKHTGEKTYECDLCNYCTTESTNIKTHMRIHTRERPHKCDKCDYSAGQLGTLETHKLIHTGEKPFRCDQCDYRCTDAGSLRRHKLQHTGQRPYTCDVCDRGFIQKQHLMSHKLIHTGDKPHKCDYCDFCSAHSGTVRRHIKRKHTSQN